MRENDNAVADANRIQVNIRDRTVRHPVCDARHALGQRLKHVSSAANGERFDRFEMTAAHRSLPFNTVVRVTALASGREVTVRITDRGPHVRGRIIDLSEQAAGELGIRDGGVARVRIEPVELPG